jgi:transposase-like protein
MAICTNCTLLVGMKKAVMMSKLDEAVKRKIVGQFVDGEKTFKEVAEELGLSHEQMEKALNPLFWDEKIEGD